MKKDKNEIFDKVLGQASKIALTDLINEYPTIEELEGKYTFSKKHQRRITSILKKDNTKRRYIESEKWHKIRRFSFNAAAVVCMIFTLSTLLAFAVPPIRIAITNFVLERNSEYIDMDAQSCDEVYPYNDIECAPSYIPKGFAIQEISSTETMSVIAYVNDDDKIIRVTRYAGEVGFTLDGEDIDFDDIMINDNKGYISIKNEQITIMFYDNVYTYQIVSETNKFEAIKIAESITK